jgi:hypothetical protein
MLMDTNSKVLPGESTIGFRNVLVKSAAELKTLAPLEEASLRSAISDMLDTSLPFAEIIFSPNIIRLHMECSIERYELNDRERPSPAAERFEKKVAKEFYKKQHPEVKPGQVFVGWKQSARNKGSKKGTKKRETVPPNPSIVPAR